MKKIILFVVGVIVIVLLTFGIASSLVAAKLNEVSAPATLDMKLICVTPHGHQVYAYQRGFDYIYVVVRHADGMPLGITVANH